MFEISILFSIIRDFFIVTGYPSVTIKDIFNIYFNFLIPEDNTNIHSVSLIPYDSKLGFMFIVENRKGMGEVIHLLGGKVENNEKEIPLYAACREFIEESYINIPIDNLYEFVKNSKHTYFDVDTKTGKKLNKYSFTSSKIHRFYIVDISNKNEINDEEEIRHKILKLNETFIPKINGEVRSVFYWNFDDNLIGKTSLLDYFLKSNLQKVVSEM